MDPAPYTKDWYGKYKQRVLSDLNTCKKVACVDLGSFLCKFAVVDRDNSALTTSTIESVVALVGVSFLRYLSYTFVCFCLI